ncbi:hypothetical protein [Lysinibacillus sphaericus]|uniref:hypothetical protein n=1 Tax=Lysinibacillus sphaericus TaxID=1421 RepID=UPI0018CFC8C2|nr:hypothetical protein [Lysinibacillus sphaericus]
MTTNTGQFAFLKGSSYEIGQQVREFQKNPFCEIAILYGKINFGQSIFSNESTNRAVLPKFK